MLNFSQKAKILSKSGGTVPLFPARRLPVQERHLLRGDRAPQAERDADAEQEAAVEVWNQQIETLYVAYVASRAARSLHESEEARRLDELRLANIGSSKAVRSAGPDHRGNQQNSMTIASVGQFDDTHLNTGALS